MVYDCSEPKNSAHYKRLVGQLYGPELTFGATEFIPPRHAVHFKRATRRKSIPGLTYSDMEKHWKGNPRKRRSRKRFEEIPLCIASASSKRQKEPPRYFPAPVRGVPSSRGPLEPAEGCTEIATHKWGGLAELRNEEAPGTVTYHEAGDEPLRYFPSPVRGVTGSRSQLEPAKGCTAEIATHRRGGILESWQGGGTEMVTNHEADDAWNATQDSQEVDTEGTRQKNGVERVFSDEPENVEDIQGTGSNAYRDLQNNDTQHSLVSGCEDLGRLTASQQYKRPPTISNWRVLWALFMTNGSRKLSKDQYQSVRNYSAALIAEPNSAWKSDARHVSNNSENVSVLPHYSTLHKTFKPIVLNFLAPRGQEMLVSVDMSKAGARFTSLSASGCPEISQRVIMPSEYARADVGSPPVWSLMQESALSALERRRAERNAPEVSCTESCDNLPVVSARDWFYGFPKCLYVDDANCQEPFSDFAEFGDTVTVSLLDHVDLVEPVARCFSTSSCPQRFTSLCGIVAHSWSVHHASRSEDLQFSEDYDYTVSPRDTAIASVFNFVQYRSPTDSVQDCIPDFPVEDNIDIGQNCTGDSIENPTKRKKRMEVAMAEASGRRRAALKERKKQMNAAWQNWRKPILKPGDFVVLLRPCDLQESDLSQRNPRDTILTSIDKQSRLGVVSRFWVEQEERNRHLFWIPGGADLESSLICGRPSDDTLRQYCSPIGVNSIQLYRSIRSLRLELKHDGERGPEKRNPVSSTGVLDSGELYFVYRFVLFWDGFEVQAGKSASGDGIYMQCLNIPLQHRSSTNAIRILSLTPPGVKASTVLRHLIPDIITGMTEGFRDIDAEGHRRRIFLDLVGVLGDTPALNSVLDILGHTAAACCHLCVFKRQSSTLLGSRYTDRGTHGFHSSTRRGFYQHAAMHDSDASTETCRLLGVRANPDLSDMPLHVLRSEMLSAKTKIPTVNGGTPVVPCAMDPYRACFIAPDHLLTGHLRDCVSLAFKLLPSKTCRESVERRMMACLSESGLPTQNRLFDHEKKALYAMSMTEIYALGTVAEIGFLRGLAEAVPPGNAPEAIDEKCRSAISLVGSFTRLISLFWRRPEKNRDGPLAVRVFEHQRGMSRIYSLQRAVDVHISKAEELCKMEDRDFQALDSNACSPRTKRHLANIYRSCHISVRTIDKPNVHRLREMTYTLLPMVGHVATVGELILEKTHQSLKRSLKQSNNRDAHLQAMRSISFDDWQGRMTLLMPGVFRRDNESMRGCLRLLAGREAIARIEGVLSEFQNDHILRTLGPEHCIRTELERQGRSVLAPRANIPSTLKWSLSGAVQQVHVQNHTQMHSNLDFVRSIFVAFKSDIYRYVVMQGTEINSTLADGAAGYSFRRGDVVEILCFRPEDPAFHYPFFVQYNCVSYLGNLSDTSGPALWCIICTLSLSEISGKSEFYVIVRPCRVLFGPHGKQDLDPSLSFQSYIVDPSDKLFFARTEDSMRKIETLHICPGDSCMLHVSRRPTAHQICSTVLNGSPFYAMTRSKGFPPRRG